MYTLQKIFKKALYAFTAVFAGLLLFTVLFSIKIEGTLLNPGVHSELFKKYDIYSGTKYLIASSMTGLIENLKNNSPEVYEQQKNIFDLLEKNLTNDLIVKNLDSLREGIFEYFKNDRKFLPDIYLSAQPEEAIQASGSTLQAANETSRTLSQISKVNLGAILMYMNRYDISDYLSMLKMIYFIINSIPGLLLPCFLLLFLIGLGLFRKFSDVVKWFSIALISCGILEALWGTALYIYAYVFLPNDIYPITMTLSLGNEPLLAYIRDLLTPVALFLLITSSTFIIAPLIAFFAPRFFNGIFFKEAKYSVDNPQKTYIIIRNSLYIFCIIILTAAIGIKVNDFRKDFIDNDFVSVVTKMKGVATVTQVISAKDAAIYDVQLKVVDEKSEKPISNVEINITGKASETKDDINITKNTNDQGEIKFSLDKGSFRLAFNQSSFPTKYKMPTPYFFDLKAAGTKVISINLEPVPETKPKWGFAEIEILDSDNNPVSGLELAVLGIPFAPGYPDKVFSSTNSEGIAVFKLNEGTYKVNFTEGKFPHKYELPPNLEITINSNTLSRYTIRLVDIPAHSPSPSPSR